MAVRALAGLPPGLWHYDAKAHMLERLAGASLADADLGAPSGLSSLTTQAHFHCCTTLPFSGTANVAVDAPTLPIPIGVSAGSFGAALDLDDLDNFLARFITESGGLNQAISRFVAVLSSAQVYLNIHSNTFPRGEICGFRRVPEPVTTALTLVALAALAAVGNAFRNHHIAATLIAAPLPVPAPDP